MLHAYGVLLARRRWWVLAAWLVLVVGAAQMSSQTPGLLSASIGTTGTEADQALAIVHDQFPGRQAPILFVVFQSDRAPIEDPAYVREVEDWRTDLQALVRDKPIEVSDPIPGRDGRTVQVALTTSANDAFLDVAHRARKISHSGPAQAYLGGTGPVYDTFITDSEQDLQQSERLSAPIGLALLLLVFGGLAAAGFPILTGLGTVTVAVALLGLAARLHTVSIFALNISSVLGVGLGIDYSLLVVNRFREELRRGESVEDAVGTTVATAGLSTAISGGTVLIGFGGLLLSRLSILWSIGLGGAIVVAVSVVASLTLIPALLAVVGRHVDSLQLPFTKGHNTAAFWSGLAAGVMRRPVAFIILTLAVVLILASPARALHVGVVGSESLPPEDPAVTAQAIAQKQLGLPAHAPILVVASGMSTAADTLAMEATLRSLVDGQTVTGPPDVSGLGQALYWHPPYAIFEVTQPAGDNDDRTHAFLDRLRHAHWPTGTSVLLGGEAAAYQDFVSVLFGDLPRVVGVVLGLTLILLGLAFRSLALPVKAVMMNLLSITAAMGVLTWVFQEGHLSALLGFQPVGFVEATVPAIIFAGLFGLSMDYEVFLLSRIREEYGQRRDNQVAVARGMERTGQIITSAALILVVVVSTLDLSHLTINKSLGVTFSIAILLDATLIRLILVPAMMRLLGRWNWWPAHLREGIRAIEPREAR